MDYVCIKFELTENTAHIRLNRPDKLNSFTVQMHEELADALNRVEAQGVRVLVLSGEGRGFCAGQDLSERQMNSGEIDLGHTVDTYYAPLVRRLRAMPWPVVVGVNGVAAGAGANLALAGDIVIAAESASFIQPFCRLGLLPDTGGTYFLPRLVGEARAKGLALLGDKLTATQAAQWGLIWECVADDAFEARLNSLCEHFATAPTKGLAASKHAIQVSLDHTLDQQLDLERDTMRQLGQSADYAEGVDAFMNKRQPQFKGK
ncbi:2-(1,2-epoxy-1,2-dihydrophenyl)acetyl-CoA isomerase [Paenalcaligenes hominis]|uniref:2-(1,2-epoxy-1,2-dihydrophenyl)acetyl-CoA isomerase n=1 Tax=Paenalcaligenes hominis TaxID=643674 RepID=A0A1U9JZ15_9BURK|nr:2-(1,2-epoxy-1,2-dihydrophenyl)acetyl-CoA isomerase PaaG [Paenalcaligenes hominis]AQS51006.1 2-(1,2-epoxy-1,2-dihydrophenyl)acetyl-CoA isomerase [Paenalcaligenes hominis]